MKDKFTKNLDIDDIVSADFLEDIDEITADISSINTIHDKYQFESNFNFDFKSQNDIDKKIYDIDIYFFIPKSVGINKDTYKVDQFYSDLTNYLRIRTPDIFKWNKFKSDDFFLKWSDKYFSVHLSTQKRQKLESAVIQEVKLFGCFINTQLKELQTIFVKILKKNKDTKFIHPIALKALLSRIENIEKIINVYRQTYLLPIRKKMLLMDPEVKRVFLLTDEYISNQIEIVFIRLDEIIKKNKLHAQRLIEQMEQILTLEVSYRKKVNFINIDYEKNEEILENYYYRLGLLKKYVSEVLFLKTEHSKKENTYKNIVAGIAAGIAATFATVAETQRLQFAIGSGRTTFGISFVSLVFLGVVIYIFKDRIKEIIREYFSKKLKRFLPDFEIKIFYNYFNEEGELKKDLIGRSKEFVRFIKKDAIPPEINYIRDLEKQKEFEPERNEEILHYSKKIIFNSNSDDENLSKVQFIKNITRFAINEFLSKLDDPNKTVHYFNSEKGILSINAPKVYHLNVIFHYSTSHQKNKKSKTSKYEFERIRILLDKKGIIRIETILPRGELNYSEENR